ncbi:MAG: diaminopimelate epimerase [Patescibacteria group bacterium]
MEFYKYHGTGNDFIVVDNRSGKFDSQDIEKIKMLCHRRFGIGADGILLLEESNTVDFKMIYINSDGSRGSMCGNGGRCIVHFANTLGLVKDPRKVKFEAVDGIHEAEILDYDSSLGLIKLKMQDVDDISERNGLPFICQGTTPHNIKYVENLKDFPVFVEGKKIADSDPDRMNTNFVEIKNGVLHVRTYERGVEDETWACGTGATSVAIASHHLGKLRENVAHISMPGGELTVKFEPQPDGTYQNIYLTGPAVCVFKGEIK